jgi:hypothetical protein
MRNSYRSFVEDPKGRDYFGNVSTHGRKLKCILEKLDMKILSGLYQFNMGPNSFCEHSDEFWVPYKLLNIHKLFTNFVL